MRARVNTTPLPVTTARRLPAAPDFRAVLAGPPPARAAMRGGGEAAVAGTAAPALRDDQGVSGRERLADELAGRGVAHLGAGGHGEVEVGPRLSGHVLALAVLP